jgi:hypothetical protein
MSKKQIQILLLFLLINCYLSQIPKYIRKFRPKPTYNSSTKFSSSLKFHSKLLQTVYSDSFSKNYYYTTLYVGDKKVKQTYILDTGSAIMSSPCSPCEQCGSHKNNYFYDFNRYHKPLQCNSRICNLVPATDCFIKGIKSVNKNSCSFNYFYQNQERNEKDGIKGYYLRDIVYFETARSKNSITNRYSSNNVNNNERIVFRSYAVPIGCTNGEMGEFRNLKTDGIMGLNNSPKSFISVLYNLKIIPENKFSLCFGLYGGYMSLGEIDTTFHKSNYIEYIPLLNSNDEYLINIDGISLNDNENNFISGNYVASIETRHSKSYFPQHIYKSIIKEFDNYCNQKNSSCGKFEYHPEGYCAVFRNRLNLYTTIIHHWPDIKLHLSDAEYTWKPLHYYYYSFSPSEYKACLGFDGHKSENIILGANFIHGHDIIFDRTYKRLGIVPADCSRGNRIWHRNSLNKSLEFLEDPSLIDLEIHKNDVFNLGDNTQKDMVDFVEGHNTELEIGEEFKTVNFIIFLSSLIIVGIIVSIILFILFFNKKGNLKYEPREEVEYKVEQQNESNTSDDNNVDENGEENGDGEGENQDGDNKISFADNVNNSNENENNVEKEDDNNENDK